MTLSALCADLADFVVRFAARLSVPVRWDLVWSGVQAAGSVAQVVTAIVALYFAYKAVRSNRDAIFIQSIVSNMFEIVTKARVVRRRYLLLLDAFQDGASRDAARDAWLASRDEVSALLHEVSQLLPEIRPAYQSWLELEREEHHHILATSHAAASARTTREATERYGRVHEAFLNKMGEDH